MVRLSFVGHLLAVNQHWESSPNRQGAHGKVMHASATESQRPSSLWCFRCDRTADLHNEHLFSEEASMKASGSNEPPCRRDPFFKSSIFRLHLLLKKRAFSPSLLNCKLKSQICKFSDLQGLAMPLFEAFRAVAPEES